MPSPTSAALLLTLLILSPHSTLSRILSECEAAKELAKAGVPRTFISNFVCVMKTESKFNTSLKMGPGHKASYSYGVFQISSDRWCNAFRKGGECNMKCDDFLNDNIQDDIACANLIFEKEGFKHWKGWLKSCKNGNLPNVGGCMIKRDLKDEGLFDKEELIAFVGEAGKVM